jgi:hypothetical protein
MFTKHRDAKDTFLFDFTKDLAVGETLSVPAVKVAQRTGQEQWTDRSAEFVLGAPTIVTNVKVQFTLKAAAAASEQLTTRKYDVYVKADTSQGRILVGTTELEVTRVGS